MAATGRPITCITTVMSSLPRYHFASIGNSMGSDCSSNKLHRTFAANNHHGSSQRHYSSQISCQAVVAQHALTGLAQMQSVNQGGCSGLRRLAMLFLAFTNYIAGWHTIGHASAMLRNSRRPQGCTWKLFCWQCRRPQRGAVLGMQGAMCSHSGKARLQSRRYGETRMLETLHYPVREGYSDTSNELHAMLARFPRRLATFLKQAAPASIPTEAVACSAIEAARVMVDGKVADDPQLLLYPEFTSSVELDGQPLPLYVSWRPPVLYYIDKPGGSTCDNQREHGLVGRACRALGPGFNHVGRLDRRTSGLLLLTDNGELLRLINVPGLLPKTYRVAFAAPSLGPGLTVEQRNVLTSMCDISRASEREATWARFESISPAREVFQNQHIPPEIGPQSRYEVDVKISSGQNHVVKRLMQHVGMSVLSLRRIAVGPIVLRDEDQIEDIIPSERNVPKKPKKEKGKTIQPRDRPTPEQVRVSEADLDALLEALDFPRTLVQLRRADLICRWRATGDARLGAWLNVTEEERSRSCHHGFPHLKCQYKHPPPGSPLLPS